MTRPPGTEIKTIGSHEYAYRTTTVWDPKAKKRRKVSKYLGKWDGRRIVTPPSRTPGGAYELGNALLADAAVRESGIGRLLAECFPEDREQILLIALNRVMDPRPLKSIGPWFEKTYLSRTMRPATSPKMLSACLARVGDNPAAQRKLFNALIPAGEKLAYDVSHIFSTSKGVNLAELGRNADGLLLPQVCVLLAFSRAQRQPCYLRLAPGSVADVKTLRVFVEELRDRSAFVIMDKGFLDTGNLDQLDSAGFRFILPLRRNSVLIDYAKPLKKWFMFRSRAVKCAAYKRGRWYVYVYEDVLLRATEENEAYALRSIGKEPSFRRERAGRIALVSNAELSAEEAYALYKSRDDVEKAFDVFKNLLDVDAPHVRSDAALRGYLFIAFIGLVVYYRLLKKLADAGVGKRMSVRDALLELSKVYAIDIGDREVVSEAPKKARELAHTLGLKLELSPKQG